MRDGVDAEVGLHIVTVLVSSAASSPPEADAEPGGGGGGLACHLRQPGLKLGSPARASSGSVKT